jgi:hypothetical protein
MEKKGILKRGNCCLKELKVRPISYDVGRKFKICNEIYV